MANTNQYRVYARDTGGAYITERAQRSPSGQKYRWAKCSKSNAAVMSYNTARKVVQRYGGRMEVV